MLDTIMGLLTAFDFSAAGGLLEAALRWGGK
jgi:hypothetical protein